MLSLSDMQGGSIRESLEPVVDRRVKFKRKGLPPCSLGQGRG